MVEDYESNKADYTADEPSPCDVSVKDPLEYRLQSDQPPGLIGREEVQEHSTKSV
jgi:hypothetical protein